MSDPDSPFDAPPPAYELSRESYDFKTSEALRRSATILQRVSETEEEVWEVWSEDAYQEAARALKAAESEYSAPPTSVSSGPSIASSSSQMQMNNVHVGYSTEVPIRPLNIHKTTTSNDGRRKLPTPPQLAIGVIANYPQRLTTRSPSSSVTESPTDDEPSSSRSATVYQVLGRQETSPGLPEVLPPAFHRLEPPSSQAPETSSPELSRAPSYRVSEDLDTPASHIPPTRSRTLTPRAIPPAPAIRLSGHRNTLPATPSPSVIPMDTSSNLRSQRASLPPPTRQPQPDLPTSRTNALSFSDRRTNGFNQRDPIVQFDLQAAYRTQRASQNMPIESHARTTNAAAFYSSSVASHIAQAVPNAPPNRQSTLPPQMPVNRESPGRQIPPGAQIPPGGQLPPGGQFPPGGQMPSGAQRPFNPHVSPFTAPHLPFSANHAPLHNQYYGGVQGNPGYPSQGGYAQPLVSNGYAPPPGTQGLSLYTPAHFGATSQPGWPPGNQYQGPGR